MYLDTLHIEQPEMDRIQNYLDLIRQRSTGQLKTPATWIREFVLNHPKYKKDSVVSEEINYDLMRAVDEMCVKLCGHASTSLMLTSPQ